MPSQSRPVVRPSIEKIKSSKADTFETITELDGGLGEDNKTVFTTTWRLDYDSRRVHFLKSRVDNGQQVDIVITSLVQDNGSQIAGNRHFGALSDNARIQR